MKKSSDSIIYIIIKESTLMCILYVWYVQFSVYANVLKYFMDKTIPVNELIYKYECLVVNIYFKPIEGYGKMNGLMPHID